MKLPLEFSLLLNGRFSEGTGSAKREQMAQVIAQYPNAPTADELVPATCDPGLIVTCACRHGTVAS